MAFTSSLLTMKNIFLAGHKGMVGSSIYKNLIRTNDNIITANRSELDLIDQSKTLQFFEENNFDEVYLAAAKVGGIYANKIYPADFIYQNLMIQNNIIHASYKSKVKKLLFLGSSCIYPKLAEQPISEDALLNGYLESSNEPYAIAKIAGIKMCESYNRQYGTDFRSIMPTNLYGPGDNFDYENSHVIPALIRKFHDAKIKKHQSVLLWGTGSAMREFLYVDDMAEASIHIMNLSHSSYKKATMPMISHINVGSGIDCSIKDLAEIISEIVDFNGEIEWDVNKPDGTPRKLLDITKIKSLGWQNKYSLRDGLSETYKWFCNNQDTYRK